MLVLREIAKQVKKLIAGPGVYICDECIDLCNEIIEEELSRVLRSCSGTSSRSPGDLRLPRPYVIGQDTAKRTLSVAVYNHYKRSRRAGARTASVTTGRACQVEHSAAGSHRIVARRLLAQTLARMLNVPFRDRRRHRAHRGGLCR